MIRGSIQEADRTILNIYAPNRGSPQYIRQLLTTLKGQIDNNTIIVGDFNTPLTAMDRSTRQKINKETQALNDALNQMDLITIYRTFHANGDQKKAGVAILISDKKDFKMKSILRHKEGNYL